MWTNIETSTRTPKKKVKSGRFTTFTQPIGHTSNMVSVWRKVAGDNHQEVVYRQHKRVILTQKKMNHLKKHKETMANMRDLV